jgi:hypothetical protein
LYAWLALSSLHAVGCGWMGRELKPLELDAANDAEVDADAAVPDDANLDAGELDGDVDASLPDSGQDASPLADGCVLSDAGACRSCTDAYVSVTCGVGYCNGSGSPSKCVDGVEIGCVPGQPRATSDTTCDGVDDNCNGTTDENYVGTETSCGTGVCVASGALTCNGGATFDVCVPKAALSVADDATGAGNGMDDDCDGRIDEDVSACDTTPRQFEAGVHANIAVPSGCRRATIQLWGGAGAAGGEAGISAKALGGRGGSGGYASSTLDLTGPLTIYVGAGGFKEGLLECGPGGVNLGDSETYSGGSGGGGEGDPGRDGRVAGGGDGAANFPGEDGAVGHYGGGGGGAGTYEPVNGPSGLGGGGGAASVVLLNGRLVMVAGGGGGGGGAAALVYNFAYAGGNGGEGCGGDGTAGEHPRTGGGGGGGVCMGMFTSVGSNGRPANATRVPAPRARGVNAHCESGGNGYAIVTFAQ